MRVIAVDLGATNLRVALFEDARLVRVKTVRTPRSGPKTIIASTIASLAREVSQGGSIDAVGIASIGPLDMEKGWVVDTPNNPIRTFPLKGPLEEELGAPVYLYNDCVAAVWGEKVLGDGSRYRDLGYITISTGIGGGFIVDGRLLLGRRGNAHEIGHMVVDIDSERICGCGGRGHWEAIASGTGIPWTAKIYAESWRGKQTEAYKKALESRLSPEELYTAAKQGDDFAASLAEYLNRVHAAGIASVAAAYDPEAIYMGGSIFLNNIDVILPGIMKFLEEYAIWKPVIKKATFGGHAGLYGAAAVALNPPTK
ncbi:MAG: ROK family protein [Desulfurococcales archaeon]|nr:ROK family protein [Desulfurococcales archaeon]